MCSCQSNGQKSQSKFGDLQNVEQLAIGIDTHKKDNHMACRADGRHLFDSVIPADPEGVLATLEGIRDIPHHIIYEAGPTGYELVRILREHGFHADVVAPGKTPQPANQGNKSDRIDAKKLARYLEQGILTVIPVPTRQEEADRQLTRLREQVRKKYQRCQNQIHSLLLQHGIEEPEDLSKWTEKPLQELEQMELPQHLRLALDTHLESLRHFREALRRIREQIKEMSESDRFAEKCKIARTHPGVGLLSGMSFLTEIFRPERFDGPEGVTKLVGLAPYVHQTGQRRREGGTIPAGREYLRRLLVQAAWNWVRTDHWAAQKFRHLIGNTGHPNKAIVAMARRLTVNLWCMVNRRQPYIQGGTGGA